MLFRMEFEVVYLNGGTETVTSRPSTDVAFERKFGVTVASLFTSVPTDGEDLAGAMRWIGNVSDEHTCFIAWHASRAPLEFDDWLDTVAEVKWNFTKPVGPTPPAQLAGSYANSQS